MGIEKIKIIAYKDPKAQKKVSEHVYTGIINPKSWSVKKGISLTCENPIASPATERRFKGVQPSTLDLPLFLDGTGLVSTLKNPTAPVKDQVEALKKQVFTVNGNIHQPNYVHLIWGKLEFKGLVSAFSYTYTLIDPSGQPLRATVNLSLTTSEDLETVLKEYKMSSPDMTHSRRVGAGNSLPLMCDSIYDDPSVYMKLARYNNLDQIRKLPVGKELEFPPIQTLNS